MHFGVCFFCVLLASESFVRAMPRPSFFDRNVLETKQIKDQNSVDSLAPRIVSPEGIHESFQNERDYDSLHNSLNITSNSENSPAFENYGSSNKAVSDDSASFSSLYPESLKSDLNSVLKQTGERNIRKKEDYSSDYMNAFMQNKSINKLIPPVNTLREPDAPMESSSITIPLSKKLNHDTRGTKDLENIPPILSTEIVQPLGNKLRKPNEETQNALKERKWEGRQGHTSVDEIGSGFVPQGRSQLIHQKRDEHHLNEGEQKRGPLHRKQRNAAVFWQKKDMPILGYDTSDMLGEPVEDSLLQNDMLYGFESSTQHSFVPIPNDISYGTGRNTYSDMGSFNEAYVPNQPLNSITGDVAAQNYQQNVQPIQFSRAYDHNYQPLSSLTNTANDFPSNSYLTANSIQSASVPELPNDSSDYLASSSDDDTMPFNKYLGENDNIGFKGQVMLPHVEEIKYPTENRDKVYENKFYYNDGMSNILNQNDRDIYPGLFRQNSYGGDKVVPGLSDSFPSDQLETGKQIAYNNYKKTKNFLNNQYREDYSSNKEFQTKSVEGHNHLDNDRGYYSDTEMPNSVEERYSYDYPGTLREMPDRDKYVGVSSQFQHDPHVNNIGTRDSYVFPPMNSISHSKSGESSSSFNKHFTSGVRPVVMDSDMPRKWQYELQKNTRKNVFERYKNPREYYPVRSKQMTPYTQDNEYAEFRPRQDSVTNDEHTDSESDNKKQRSTKQRLETLRGSEIPPVVVSDSQKGQRKNCIEEAAPTENEIQPRREADSVESLTGLDEKCGEEKGNTEAVATETTTLISSTTAAPHKKIKNHMPEAICKTDFPCSVNGEWYSHIGGVLLSLKTTNNGKLDVNILDTPSYYKDHGILSQCWNITGEIPFNPRMKSFISLKAIEECDHKFATFIGECFTCGSEDVIYGSWLFGRPAHSCKDQHIATTEYKDIFRKSHLQKRKFIPTTNRHKGE